jgi:hypothetical protein
MQKMSEKIRIGLSIALLVALQGCGGAGGTSTPTGTADTATGTTPPTTSTQAPLTPIAVKSTSYANFKEVGLTPQVLPKSTSNAQARAYADFFQRGVLDVFTATITYDLSKSTPATASPSRFEFWRKQADGTYVQNTALMPTTAGCLHPRKALVADFNNDRKPDIFVACQGYDGPPFPGEKSKVVLSQPDGTYLTKDTAGDIGFFHSATAADLNGDGFVDVMVVNSTAPERAFVFLNKGDGTFVREQTSRLPASIRGKQYFSVELVDINEDGKLDVLLGGHEWPEGPGLDAPTLALINPGSNDFSNVAPIILPAVANQGVVLDFTLTGTGATRTIWAVRTSGGDGSFYQSRVVQKISWPSLSSSVPYNEQPAQWIPWIIPVTLGGKAYLTGDLTEPAIQIPQ